MVCRTMPYVLVGSRSTSKVSKVDCKIPHYGMQIQSRTLGKGHSGIQRPAVLSRLERYLRGTWTRYWYCHSREQERKVPVVQLLNQFIYSASMIETSTSLKNQRYRVLCHNFGFASETRSYYDALASPGHEIKVVP
jgi:hypothetical protein